MITRPTRLLPPSLFGRTALVIALVSVAFQVFTLAVITRFALVPLGRQATDDFAALMLASTQSWQAASADERLMLEDRFWREYRLTIRATPIETGEFTRVLPYFFFLESTLSERLGQPVRLREATAADGSRWYWARLPTADGGSLHVGFPASRVAVQPSAALLIILLVGAAVTFLTSAWLARWLIRPLARLATATQQVGKGYRPAPLPETGPTELATLAGAFNRMAEEVDTLLANRTTLLAGISHDLRSPLTRIGLALGMLSERPAPDLLERVMRDVDHMNQLIARCLELGRDFAEQDFADIELRELLEEIAREHGAGAEIRIRPGVDCPLRAKPLALRRILSNLVDNAARYGDGRPIDVEYEMADGMIDISVMDRGPGIPEAEREAVFQPFRRLDPSRSARTGGSGLGLAIVRQIAQANGWTVTLDARPGGGTTVRLRVATRHD